MVVGCCSSSQESRDRSVLLKLNEFQARQIHFNLNHQRPRNDNEDFKREMRQLEKMLSKISPMVQGLVPPSPDTANMALRKNVGHVAENTAASGNGNTGQSRKKNGYDQGKRKMRGRTSIAQREDVIRRTVYVSDVDHQITEEQLAALFLGCGQVVDCRVCGDPKSILHFAFVEFTDEEAARAALTLSGTILGFYPVKVQPSKTAIAPVNPTFLPQTLNELEMCARTVYVTNIDKKVTQAELKLFFESLCGKVDRLRLLGDYHHTARIAFVEFTMPECAIAALNCSGAILGLLPIRVSPSKTHVHTRGTRPTH